MAFKIKRKYAAMNQAPLISQIFHGIQLIGLKIPSEILECLSKLPNFCLNKKFEAVLLQTSHKLFFVPINLINLIIKKIEFFDKWHKVPEK